MLDIFNGDAFSLTRLTQSINDIKLVPGRLEKLGLFEPDPVDVTSVAVEKQGDILVLVPPTPRGGPGVTVEKDTRSIRLLSVPHFEINDAVYAEEVQGRRAFGSETALETVMGKVARRQRIHANSLAATEELSRIGAVKGVVTYADSSTLDLFSEFGVTQIAETDWDLDNANPAEGVLRKECAGVVRTMAGELDGLPFTGLWALCGDAFFDDLLAHKEVRDSYKGWSEAQILRDGYIGPNRDSYGVFEFGGITWENYRGSVGGTGFIDTDKCHIFPMGVPGLFRTVYSPADYVETVNTLGRRFYSKQWMMDNGKGINLDSQSNNLQYCSRPRCLLQGKRT